MTDMRQMPASADKLAIDGQHVLARWARVRFQQSIDRTIMRASGKTMTMPAANPRRADLFASGVPIQS